MWNSFRLTCESRIGRRTLVPSGRVMGCEADVLGDGTVLSAAELAHHGVAAVHAATGTGACGSRRTRRVYAASAWCGSGMYDRVHLKISKFFNLYDQKLNYLWVSNLNISWICEFSISQIKLIENRFGDYV